MESCLSIVDEWGKALMNSDSGSKKMLAMLGSIKIAIDNLDILEVDEAMEKLSHQHMHDDEKENFENLRASVEISDLAACAEIVDEWMDAIKSGS